MKALLPVIILLTLLSSCKKDFQECYVPRSVSAKVYFRVMDTLITEDANGFITRKIDIRDTALNRPSLTSLGMDTTIIFQGERGITNMFLFLNSDSSQIRYAFKRSEDATLIDTLTISYDHYPQFISNACGYTYSYNLQSISSTQLNIKEAQIIDPNVNLSAQLKNIVIYIPKQ